MQRPSMPSFDDWVTYCFTRGYADFAGRDRTDPIENVDEVVDAELQDRMLDLDAVLLTEYLIRLFHSPRFLSIYTDDQLGDAVWFLFGTGSEYFHDVRSEAVSHAQQIACYAAVATLYADLFDRRCCQRGGNPADSYIHDAHLDGAVYMIWDMDNIEVPLFFPESSPHLLEPTFHLLESILMNCRTSTCQISALHGLNHAWHRHPERVASLIDAFLQTRSVAPWVADYAQGARAGRLQ